MPAMYMVGLWETTGDHVDKDPSTGLALIQEAADKNYPPALYEIAIRTIDGRDSPGDPPKGLEMMATASTLGSQQAQFYLGTRYETATGVTRDSEAACRYFRLCAVKGVAECQYRLGKLLLESPDHEVVPAVAWLQLAADQGITEALELAAGATAKLTPQQTSQIMRLKDQLVRK